MTQTLLACEKWQADKWMDNKGWQREKSIGFKYGLIVAPLRISCPRQLIQLWGGGGGEEKFTTLSLLEMYKMLRQRGNGSRLSYNPEGCNESKRPKRQKGNGCTQVSLTNPQDNATPSTHSCTIQPIPYTKPFHRVSNRPCSQWQDCSVMAQEQEKVRTTLQHWDMYLSLSARLDHLYKAS